MSKITQDDLQEYNNLISEGFSQRKACEILGIARSTMQDALKREVKVLPESTTKVDDKVNVLFWDLESSLMEGMFFRIWQENIEDIDNDK